MPTAIQRPVLIAAISGLVALAAFAALVVGGPSPARAEGEYEPDPQLIADVWGYAQETQDGYVHVSRWFRVLNAFGALEGMTAAEAGQHASTHWALRWDPVVEELINLERSPAGYQPDQQVVDDVSGYAQEMGNGYEHVLRWMRALVSFGALEAMTAAEAQGYADRGWSRWVPVAAALAEMEADTAAEPRSAEEPNQAPLINQRSTEYPWFTGRNNAPRGTLVSKPFYEIFDDPDGDELTYTVAITGGDSALVDNLQVTTEAGRKPRSWPPYGTYYRVWFHADGEDDWKAISPTLPDRPVVTVTLTATDPDGLSASVSGDFVIGWESYPEVVSATTDGETIELTFDWPVESNPAPNPEQFTLRARNEDGSSGTVAVTGASVNDQVVTLDLASALTPGQTVTLDYAYLYHLDSHNPLQRAGEGDHAPSFTGQVVEFRQPPVEPQNFAVTAEQGKLDLLAKWDASEGATSYRLRWRQAGGSFEAANALTVSGTEATFSVPRFGEWEVLLQACNHAGCVPEAGQSADQTPAVRLSLEPTGGGEGQVQTRGLRASRDQADDAASYTLGWRRTGTDAPMPTPSQSGTAQQRSANSGPSGQGGPTDPTAPRLLSGEIDSDTMTFHFSEPLDEHATGARFRVTLYFRNGWVNFTAHPSKVEVSGNMVVVVGLSRNGWPGWERATTDYGVRAYYYIDDRVVPASERLRDLDGNEISTPHRSPGGHFPATRTIRLSNLTAPPALQQATVSSRWLTLAFDDPLDRNSVPDGSAFTVSVNGSEVNLAGVEPVVVSRASVTLALESPVMPGDDVMVSYAKPLRNGLRGVDGEVSSFSGRSVTYLVVIAAPEVADVTITSTPAAGGIYAPGETISVQLTFTEAVNVQVSGGTPRLKIKMGPSQRERWADYASGSGTTMLTFTYTVAPSDSSDQGVAVSGNTLELNGGSIRSTAATPVNAQLRHGGLDHDTDHRVDGVAPSLWSAALTGETSLELIYDESLDAASQPAAGAFTVKVDGSAVSLAGTDPVVVSGAVVTLTLASTVADGSKVTVSYTRPTSSTANKLQDASGNEAWSFVDQPASSDGSSDARWTATVSGARLLIRYATPLDGDSTPPADAFTVQLTPAAGSTEQVGLSGSPTISNGIVKLTLSSAATSTDTVVVSYTKPTSGTDNTLRDLAGNDLAGFSELTASYDDTAPKLVRGEIDGAVLTQFYSEPLDENAVPPANLFKANLAGSWGVFEADQATIRGNTVVLTLAHRATIGQIVNTRYIHSNDPNELRLSDLAGNPVETSDTTYVKRGSEWVFLRATRIITIDNLTMPTLRHATVNYDQLTLRFNTDTDAYLQPTTPALDTDSIPANRAFTVKVNGSVVSLASGTPPALDDRDVTLTLASAVSATDEVVVSYEQPAANPLRTTDGDEVRDFTTAPVTNTTP